MPPKQRKVADPTMGASAAANLGSQDRNSTKEDSEVVKDIGRLVFSPAELEILPKDYLSMQYLTLATEGIQVYINDREPSGLFDSDSEEDNDEDEDSDSDEPRVPTADSELIEKYIADTRARQQRDIDYRRALQRCGYDPTKVTPEHFITWEQELALGEAQVKRTMELLAQAGVQEKDMPTSKCLLAALAKGHYGFTGKPEDLDAVVINTKGAYGCRHVITATVRELFDQPDYGGNDHEDGSENAVIECKADGCEERLYVTQLCNGKPEFDNGKFHNHCERCPGFGVCIGDYREAHCGQCHEHYFTGLTGFRCGCSLRKLFKDARAKKQMALAALHFACHFKFGLAEMEANAKDDDDDDDDDDYDDYDDDDEN